MVELVLEQKVTKKIQKIPFSINVIMRQVAEMNEDILTLVANKTKQSQCLINIQMDNMPDISDMC